MVLARLYSYKETSDSVICLYCSHAFDNKLLTVLTYLTTGFTNWKDATTSFFKKDLMSQVVTLVLLLLVMPATNAISERSFSAMKCIKTLPIDNVTGAFECYHGLHRLNELNDVMNMCLSQTIVNQSFLLHVRHVTIARPVTFDYYF